MILRAACLTTWRKSHLWQSVIVVFEHWTTVLQVRAGSEVPCGISAQQAEHTGVCPGCHVLMGKKGRSWMIIRYNDNLLYNSSRKTASPNTILRISFSDIWKQEYQLIGCQCLFQSHLDFLFWCVCSDYWWDMCLLQSELWQYVSLW